MSLLVIGQRPKCPSCKDILPKKRHTGKIEDTVCVCGEKLRYYKSKGGITYVFREEDYRRDVVYRTVSWAVACDISEE